MKKQLTLEDLKNIIDSNDYKLDITRPNKTSIKVLLKLKHETCFSCDELFNIDDLEVRLDTRVTAIATPKKFCSSCVKTLDDILSKFKGNQTRDWLK